MISNHTQQSVPASELAQQGKLSHIGGQSYRLDVPANPATGVGPVGSTWTLEPGEEPPHAIAGEIPNWRVTYNDNSSETVSIEVHADHRDDAISKASEQVRNVYFKSAVQI